MLEVLLLLLSLHALGRVGIPIVVHSEGVRETLRSLHSQGVAPQDRHHEEQDLPPQDGSLEYHSERYHQGDGRRP
jgi:hypothetical protein